MKKLNIKFLSETALTMYLPLPIVLSYQQQLFKMSQQIASHPGIIDSILGINNLTIAFNPSITNSNRLKFVLSQLWQQVLGEAPKPGKHFKFNISYASNDAPDLAYVSQKTRLSEKEIIMLHKQTIYTVFCIGFLPGFPYLGTLDKRLYLPRRSVVRQHIAAGSVAIANQWTGIYPTASPAGWHIIGRIREPIFNPLMSTPSLLKVGDTVSFESIDNI